jgi:hypothetical protein
VVAGRDTILRKASCLLLLPLLVAVSLAPATTDAQSGAPEIRSINPEHAGAGTRVTIKGRNFSTERQDNIVLFADKQAAVNKAKRKKLVVTVPEELTPGLVAVTVTVGGQMSNASSLEVIIPVRPFAGRYVGQTSQGVRFDFTVRENQAVVTQLRTSFTCAGRNCGAGATINSNRFDPIENGLFEIEIEGSNVTAKVEGFFRDPIRAEGTVEFSISGQCSCQTGKLNWTARLQ